MNDLKPGVTVLYEGTPFQVLEVKHSHIGRGGAVVETKLKNLRTGALLLRNFKSSDAFEEMELEKKEAAFIYAHRGEYWFSDAKTKQRFSLKEEILEAQAKKFLKPGLPVQITSYENEILNLELPIKLGLKVVEAPPSIKGNTAQGGTKIVKLETGTEISVPLFIETDDTIIVNTQTGFYVERAK